MLDPDYINKIQYFLVYRPEGTLFDEYTLAYYDFKSDKEFWDHVDLVLPRLHGEFVRAYKKDVKTLTEREVKR